MDRVMVEKSIAGIGLAVLFACLYGCGQVGKEVTGYITTSDRVFDLREDTLSFTDADVSGSGPWMVSVLPLPALHALTCR